jgi:hypothetical protein
MRVEDATPDAWFDDLRDVRLEDGREAVRRLTTAKPFVSLAEILTDVRKLRADRIASTPIPAPPFELVDRPLEYAAWHRRVVQEIADGTFTGPVAEITSTRPVGALLAGAFQPASRAGVARCPGCGRPSPLDSDTNVCVCGTSWAPLVTREAAS